VTPATMRAVVVREPGPADVLRIQTLPVALPRAGEVLIRVKAFGVNRSELFTRLGQSPGVTFPRVLGIEATGVVEAAPGGEFGHGDTVVTAMGGMGRQFDGGYAEFTCVPAAQVVRLDTHLPWPLLAAVPEMFQTAWGSLNLALGLQPGQWLLVRGGTTSVGLAAITLAAAAGLRVIATTRQVDRAALLRERGAGDVIVDDGAIAAALRRRVPDGVHGVLELVGATTLLDSLRCAARGGVVCMSGIVGHAWTLERFSPMEDIPSAVRLTSYSGGVAEFLATPLQRIVADIEGGRLHVPAGPVFRLDQIADAHRCMEQGRAAGKIVVVT
jgi:NADPH:quinone reductase-like Zn-dependent oxidoreductase